MAVAEKIQCRFKVGDKVKVSPQVTHLNEWIEGIVTDVEDNPFNGWVLTVDTHEYGFWFEKEYLFEKA